MRLLLDTNVLVWWGRANPTLDQKAVALLESAEAELWMSPVSPWEAAVKRASGKLDLDADHFGRALASGVRELPITCAHGEQAGALPLHHRDPFDRMLVAQAQLEGLSIVTRDRDIPRYDVHVIQV